MLSDLRFALRQLARSPGFTTVALLTLAVGIGSTTVVFSALHAFLSKPFPHITVPEDRLLYATQTEQLRKNDDAGWSYLDHLAVRERSQTLAGLWIHHDMTVILTGRDAPERLRGTQISHDAFDLLGVQPVLGRNFTAADAAVGAPNVALITAGLWKSRFAGEPDIVGRVITLNGRPATVVGVMPAEWRYPDLSDLWMPLRADADKASYRDVFLYSGRALLRPGVTLQQAQAELDTIMAALAAEFPATNTGIGARLRPIREEAIQDARHFPVLVFGAVLFVFLISCVNVANLLLVRSITRSREVAIRLALGAPRSRIIRQLVTESLILGLLGGIGGWIFGLWANDAVVAALPIEIPFWLRFEFDPVVFAFIVLLSLAAGLIFGLAPALKSSRPDLITELKEGGRSADASSPRAHRLRNALVVIEVALALVLLVGAGLMMRSFLELRCIDPGFDHRDVLTFRTGWPADMFRANPDAPRRFFATLPQKLAELPGVESAALTLSLPGRGTAHRAAYFSTERPPPARPTDAHLVYPRSVSPGLFATLRIPLLAGRAFDPALDHADSPRVAVVDERFATQHFGSPQNAIGRHIAEFQEPSKSPAPMPLQIVGVVGNIRHHLDRPDELPTVYRCSLQWNENFLSVALRTRVAPESLIPLVRDAVLSVHREIPIYDVLPLEEVMLRSETVWPRRFFGSLFAAFGAVALFLACIGIYGVMSYNVTQRFQELGVRLALGAQPREVIRLIVRHGLRLVAYGLALGLVAAFLLARLLTGLLYGIEPHDPPTFAVVPLLLVAVALLACWLPSRRATLIDPNTALRAD